MWRLIFYLKDISYVADGDKNHEEDEEGETGGIHGIEESGGNFLSCY